MNAETLIGFFKRFIKDTNKKIILILDNLRVHHAKVVKAWLKDKADKDKSDKIEAFRSIYPPLQQSLIQTNA